MKKQYENNIRKGGIAEEIAILKQRREARKAKEEKKNIPQSSGQKKKEQDQKFLKMITQKKSNLFKSNYPEPPIDSSDSKIFVVVRKRPIFQKEINNGEIDCISVINPRVYIHECKIQIDGITKYLEDHEFYFDATFGENSKNYEIYNITLYPMINLVLNQGVVTCFAYGQTGSGKTFTMNALEKEAIDDLFSESEKMGNPFDFYVSFFEIYRGSLYDLLNNKNKVEILDDKNGKVHIYGLINQIAETPEMMHHIIDSANAIRTTHNTVTNETSSRSHAICNIVIKLKNSDEEYGKLSLVDLAGSERAQETQSNDKERRAEGAEINKSLLALKECIRALDEKKSNPDQHVPFRASKLTHVLRDSFVSKNNKSRIIMISCVMPSYKCCNHSLNTLRYSDRLKEKTKHHFGGNYNNININARGVNSNPIGNNNINNNSNIHYKQYNSNIINLNINTSNNTNNNLNFISKDNHFFPKSITKDIKSPSSRLNNTGKKNNNINNNLNKSNNINEFNTSSNNSHKYPNSNYKIPKKENITSNNNNSSVNNSKKVPIPQKNDIKNNKKIEKLKSKNSGIKYEDKFFMMKEEDETDKQKRNKYNYNNSSNNKESNSNITNENNKNINLSIKENKNINAQLEEKDWDYVRNKNENDEQNNSNSDNKIIDNEKEENEENVEEDENEEEEGAITPFREKEDLNYIGEDIINKHMVIIKESANILSEEGDLITNIKGVGKVQNFTLDDYIDGLEIIVDKKLDMYEEIKTKIKKYRKAKKSNGKY
jgi:kinesin family protein 2/24